MCCLLLDTIHISRLWTRQGDHHQGNNRLCPSPVTRRVQLHLLLTGSHALSFPPLWLALLCLLTHRENKYTATVLLCVINGVRRVYFHFLEEKIWVFALPLAFNLSCRMEKLFNSSITRKCPPEQRSSTRAGMEAEEAGYLDYLHLSARSKDTKTEFMKKTKTLYQAKSPCPVNPLIF